MKNFISYRRQRHPATYVVALVVLALLLPTLAYAGLAKAVGPVLQLPTKENFRATQTIFYDRHGTKLYQTQGAHQPINVPLNQVPRSLVYATLAGEDADFYKHRGVDPIALARATYKNIFTEEQQGGSTITQQLIKNTYLSSERTVTRKLREMSYAVLVEHKFSKDQILERYMNEVYYGQQSYGVADAAKTYFGKELSQLTLGESTLLAGLPSAPTLYSPLGANPQRAKQRQSYVLDQMVKHGYIAPEQAVAAKVEPLNYAPQTDEVFHAPHFVFYVKQELSKYYGDEVVDQGGLKVYTTLDLNKQNAAEEQVRQGVAEAAVNGATNGALVAMDPKNGEVLAMVGSKNFEDDSIGGKVNVTTSERQPGSSFKPFVYLAALKNGQAANTVLHDKATTFAGSYTPRNYDGTFRGNVTMRYALANSLNIPAVETLDKVGVQPSIDLARELGISTLRGADQYGLSLVLGGGEVKLLDMTSAYGVLANSGTNPGRATVSKVLGPDDKLLYERKPVPKTVVDPGLAFIMTDILADNGARSLLFGANSPLNLPRPAAAKTGTTDNFKDNWTIGYTPNLVVGVWIGNNNGTPMRNISGIQGAAPIWNATMRELLTGLPVENFKTPPGVSTGCACVAAIGGTQREYFFGTQGSKQPQSTPSSAGANAEEFGNKPTTDTTTGEEAAPPPRNGRYPYYYFDPNGKRVYYYR